MQKIILVSGATAVGKNTLALKIANFLTKENINCKIINADSKQVYKDLKILTNQPSEYELKKFQHCLYGFINADENYSLSKWIANIENLLNNQKNEVFIIVGGTGLYLNSLRLGLSDIPSNISVRKALTKDFLKCGISALSDKLYKLDSLAAKKINPNDSYRIIRALEVILISGKSIFQFHQDPKRKIIKSPFIHFHLQIERDELYRIINKRVLKMFDEGIVEEVRNILRIYNNYRLEDKKIFPLSASIGFLEIKKYIDKLIALEKAQENIMQLTRNYAKRQLTWFRNSLIASAQEELIINKNNFQKIDKDKLRQFIEN